MFFHVIFHGCDLELGDLKKLVVRQNMTFRVFCHRHKERIVHEQTKKKLIGPQLRRNNYSKSSKSTKSSINLVIDENLIKTTNIQLIE